MWLRQLGTSRRTVVSALSLCEVDSAVPRRQARGAGRSEMPGVGRTWSGPCAMPGRSPGRLGIATAPPPKPRHLTLSDDEVWGQATSVLNPLRCASRAGPCKDEVPGSSPPSPTTGNKQQERSSQVRLPPWRHGQVTAPSDLSRSCLPASFARPLLGTHHGRSQAPRRRARRPLRPKSPDAPRPSPASPTGGGVRWNRDAAPTWPYPPVWWVGWSLATRPRAVTPRERPEDPPARGDRHRARFGDRQGPQLHLLAQARQRLSVHPADLRLALPGLPQLRAAVLQPR